MLIALTIVAVLVVFAIAAAVVGREARRLGTSPPRPVFDMDEAVAWVAQHLPFDRALLIGLAVLVVACPCAVGLAAPMATSLGIGRLARHGCLVRDPATLEAQMTYLEAIGAVGPVEPGEETT